MITPLDLKPSLFIDAEIGFGDISPSLIQTLEQFSPFGEANPEPLFLSRNLKIKDITDKGSGTRRVWFQQEQPSGVSVYPASIPAKSKLFELIDYSDCFDIIYNLVRDKQDGLGIELKVQDIRLA